MQNAAQLVRSLCALSAVLITMPEVVRLLSSYWTPLWEGEKQKKVTEFWQRNVWKTDKETQEYCNSVF